MLNIQLQIFITIAIGYAVTKFGMISKETRAQLTNLVIYIILPCNIFMSFNTDMSVEILKQCGAVILIAFAIQLAYQVLIRVLYRKTPEGKRRVLQYNIIVNNSGFLGIPVLGAAFGEAGVLFGSVALIPLRIFMWTSGLALFTKTDNKTLFKKLATHPCIIAVVLGFVYMFSGIKLPVFLTKTISSLGNCVTPVSMLVVGSILSDVDPKSVFDKDCFTYSLLRLVIIPAVTFGVLYLIGVDETVRGVMVLVTAMPAATVCAMLAQKYDKDAPFAAKVLFVSTVLSLVTLPIGSAVLK